MTDKRKIKEEFDNFRSAYHNLESLTEGMSPDELELIHKIQAVLEKHEDVLEDGAIELLTYESEIAHSTEDSADSKMSESDESSDCTGDTPIRESAEDSESDETPSDAESPEEHAFAPLPEPPQEKDSRDIFDRISHTFLSWQPSTRIGKWIRRDRHNAFITFVLLLALITGIWQAVSYAVPERVSIIYETVEKLDTIELSTRAATVQDVLDESGLEIGSEDLVTPVGEHQIEDGMEIRVRHATNSTCEYGGKKVDILVIPGTVKDILDINDLAYDDDDIISPSLNTKMTTETKLVVKNVEIETETRTEKVKARSVVRLDPSLKSGVQEKVQGHDGKAVFEYRTTYINGKKKGTKKVVVEWKSKVQDNELRLGTSLTGHKGEFVVEDEFIGNTTAYWMGNNARGASGGRCVYGTCAVDPKRIPYGTDMWVEGYGYALANDCGSAIKNDHVDLWMHSYKESCQWGRRFVTVYVLKKK